MLEYDVYAHVDGIDYQLCGLPITIRWTDDFDINNTTLFLSSHDNTILKEGVHFTIAYDYIAKWAKLTFNVIVSSCRLTCRHITTSCTKTFPKFDVVRKITIQTQEDCMVHAALAMLIRQNEETHNRTQLLMIMYQKMCQMLVEFDPKRQ